MLKVLFNKFKSNPHLQVLGVILIIALFLRSYKIIDWFDFAHDGDLYSWIVKDIIVDKHLRLIGQLTSAPGIFIGPLFYYLLIPFFLITRMDPVGAIIPILIIGISTVASYYYVFSKLWNSKIGLIASFLYASLLDNVQFDRRVVPSTPTNIWLIWYFFTIIMISRGNYSVLPLLGLLIGLIWHIHIALIPSLSVIPIAFYFARKIPSRKQIYSFIIALLIPSIPLIAFEARHGFSQTLSFANNMLVNQMGGTGIEKLQIVIIKLTGNIMRLFFYPYDLPIISPYLFVVLVLLSAIILVKRRLIKQKELIIFYFWIILNVLFYSISSVVLSEYYLASINILFLTIISFVLYLLYQSSNLGKCATLILCLGIFASSAVNIHSLYTFRKGYVERKSAATFITDDSRKKGFECISISYITSPGENVGFRYFFWLNGLNLTKVQKDSVTYSIVNPPEFASAKEEKYFGQIKVIIPDEIPTKEKIKASCGTENTNLTDPLFGFTK